MNVVAIPARLSLAALMVNLSIPIAGIEIILAARQSWWSLSPIAGSIQIWTVITAMISIPLSVWLARGSRWALSCLQVLLILWCLYVAREAVITKNFWLGLFNLVVATYWAVLVYFLKTEMSRSYFDPHLEWYQDLPVAVPRLKCAVEKNSQRGKSQPAESNKFSVSRIDRDGLFVFGRQNHFQNVDSRQIYNIELSYQDKMVQVQGKAVRVLPRGQGVGLRFYNLSADHRKEIGDFVEALKGEGYV